MIIDEYLNQPVTLDWKTDDFDLATRIIRRLEERKIVYMCEKKDKWSFEISTNNQNALAIIEMVRTG